MIVKALIENTTDGDYFTEHGLSLYIEASGHKILFDTGQSGLFLRNADKMGVDLSEVEIVVISHGHYDHGGGLRHFFTTNNSATVYINQYAFEPHYALPDRNIGIDPDLKNHRQVVLTGDHHYIAPEFYLFTGNDSPTPFLPEKNGLVVMRGGEMVSEDYIHEQYLVIEEENKRVLITGCSHKGILNVMHWMEKAPPDVVIGGFHLSHEDFSKESKEKLDDLAATLVEYETVYYTCHCTGAAPYAYLKARMDEELNYISAGQELKI